MESATKDVHVAVMGAGLAGAMMAALLTKLGFKITLYERRGVATKEEASKAFGNAASSSDRSINLALSYRGILALQEIGLVDEVMKFAVRMPRRVIHSLNGEISLQNYGINEDECLYSVSRKLLNELLLEYVQKCPNVEVKTGVKLLKAEGNGKCFFQNEDGSQFQATFDLIVGADGAFSAVRESILRNGRVNFQRIFIKHGYKELCIPAKINADGSRDYALQPHNGLHIWPRHDFMLIALPNADCTFTATLFAPHVSDTPNQASFASVNIHDKKAIETYFQTNFNDVLKVMPNFVNDYINNPIGSLMTLRVNPWYDEKLILIGDAAHAVVPFYGQGMNAAFEDALLLYRRLHKHLSHKAILTISNDMLIKITHEFGDKRRVATDCLSELCLEHYNDMASNTDSTLYLIKKKCEGYFEWFYEKFLTSNTANYEVTEETQLSTWKYRSIYRYIAFSNVPYHLAIQTNEQFTRNIFFLTLGLSTLGLTAYSVGMKNMTIENLTRMFGKSMCFVARKFAGK